MIDIYLEFGGLTQPWYLWEAEPVILSINAQVYRWSLGFTRGQQSLEYKSVVGDVG